MKTIFEAENRILRVGKTVTDWVIIEQHVKGQDGNWKSRAVRLSDLEWAALKKEIE